MEGELEEAEKLRQEGNECFKAEKYESAIEKYTKALQMQGLEVSLEAALSSNRSAALASLCHKVRSRPAAASERDALFGLDPTQIAEMALKDAEKACKLESKSAKAQGR